MAPQPVTITFDMALEEHEARVAFGISASDYEELPGVPAYCDEDHPISKCDVLAFYRISKLIRAVEADVNARQAKKRRGR